MIIMTTLVSVSVVMKCMASRQRAPPYCTCLLLSSVLLLPIFIIIIISTTKKQKKNLLFSYIRLNSAFVINLPCI